MAEQLSTSEKIHYTNKWCRSIGIKFRDLDNHSAIDDVILLINFRNTFWSNLNRSEQGMWAALWNRVYHKQYYLKKKQLDQLEIMANSAQFEQAKQAQRLQQIQALRANSKELKKGTHMTANCSLDADLLIRV
jgi:hypothetical protein